MKQPDCPNGIKSQLHRIFGKLYASVGNPQLALQQLANDIYYSSLEFGPLSFHTCGGYYQMGNVFQAKNSVDCALAMYEKVVEICIDTLVAAIKKHEETGMKLMDEAEQVECYQMLTKIVATRQQILGTVHASTAETYFALGLIQAYMRSLIKAKQNLDKAYEVLQAALGPAHTRVHQVRGFLERVNRELQVTTSSPRAGRQENGTNPKRHTVL
eukprot:TRINITY_DN3096_c0_g1_i1.p1 TRINITY_DN3096_c0_g1~~TRINITY_DN3096_c0_g1_i1.p1  ORF type:complete len:214 (-),score=47.70 TRINITY_DN3096_c0_g1_i1:38-679(-)